MIKHMMRTARPQSFHTANGSTCSDIQCPIYCDELSDYVDPYVLESTPAVMSVGYRCMQRGYTFIWPAGEDPYFVLPSGKIVYLEVVHDVPYLRPGRLHHAPRSPNCKRTFPGRRVPHDAAPGPASSSHEPVPVEEPGALAGETDSSVDPRDPETMGDADEADALLAPPAQRSLREAARSVEHQLTHKPKNPYCPHCCRGQMRNARK